LWILEGGRDGVGNFAILVHVDAAVRRDTQRKLRAQRDQERHQAMIEQVRRDATGVVPVFAPAKVAVLAERVLRSGAQEALPIDILSGSLGIDLIVPFAV